MGVVAQIVEVWVPDVGRIEVVEVLVMDYSMVFLVGSAVQLVVVLVVVSVAEMLQEQLHQQLQQ